ncbi:11206_t:CDS:2 [Ambispora leptoticha]|uniref:11206_t:CDS:1 n=1 Tax=Ambispora leptoticha TaxID=144679 RepID=A0A9N9A6C5_9GLOM|nr:11206_t:CDS:2 [Ambispora leptoticha]
MANVVNNHRLLSPKQDDFTWSGKDRSQSTESKAGRFWDLIDESKQPWPYTQPVINSIRYRQKEMEGELFIHLLLKFAGVDPTLYPPAERPALKELSDAIYSSKNINELQAHCLMYYILRDWNGSPHQKYVVRYLIPYGWISLMDGFWSLDQWNFEEAIRFLGEPEVKKVDYNRKVIQTLFNHSGPREAMMYVDITKPDLSSKKEDAELLLDLLMRCDLIETLFYLRNLPEEFDKGSLFRKLLDYCFNEVPRADKLNKLLSFPLNKEEESVLEDYCLKSDNPVCLEFYVMYAVHHDRKIEAIRLYDRVKSQLKSARAKASSFLKRGKIIENIRKNLSPIEKQLLLSQDSDSEDIIKVDNHRELKKERKQNNRTISPPGVLSPLTTLANENVFTTPVHTSARAQMTTPLPNKSPFSPASNAPSSPSTVKSSIKNSTSRGEPYSTRRITRSMTRKQPTPFHRGQSN